MPIIQYFRLHRVLYESVFLRFTLCCFFILFFFPFFFRYRIRDKNKNTDRCKCVAGMHPQRTPKTRYCTSTVFLMGQLLFVYEKLPTSNLERRFRILRSGRVYVRRRKKKESAAEKRKRNSNVYTSTQSVCTGEKCILGKKKTNYDAMCTTICFLATTVHAKCLDVVGGLEVEWCCNCPDRKKKTRGGGQKERRIRCTVE